MTLSILPRGLFYILIRLHILPLHSSKELIRTTEISEELSDYPPLDPKMLTRHLQQNGTTPQEQSFKRLPLHAKKGLDPSPNLLHSTIIPSSCAPIPYPWTLPQDASR